MSNKTWSDEDHVTLLKLREHKKASFSSIGRVLGRTAKACTQRYSLLKKQGKNASFILKKVERPIPAKDQVIYKPKKEVVVFIGDSEIRVTKESVTINMK